MPAGADRTALAIKLFGKGRGRHARSFPKGSGGIQELMKQSDALGTTMSCKVGQSRQGPHQVPARVQGDDRGVQISLGRALYPTLTHLGTTLLPMLAEGRRVQQGDGQTACADRAEWPIVQQKIKEVFDEVGWSEQSVRRNWPGHQDMFVRVGDALNG